MLAMLVYLLYLFLENSRRDGVNDFHDNDGPDASAAKVEVGEGGVEGDLCSTLAHGVGAFKDIGDVNQAGQRSAFLYGKYLIKRGIDIG